MALPSSVDDNPVPEASGIQLTRMEGVLNLVSFKVSSLVLRVDRHEDEIATLKSRTQSLTDGFRAANEKAEALALALKEAKEAVEATALQEASKAQVAAREKSDRDALGWSPITKLFAVLAGILIVVNIYQAINPSL